MCFAASFQSLLQTSFLFFFSYFLRNAEIHCEKNTEIHWVRWAGKGMESNRAEPDEAAFSWFCCWPKGISGGSAKWKLSPHVERRDWDRERERRASVEPSGSAVGFQVFALPTQLCPLPSANPSVYVCHGEGRKGRQCRRRVGSSQGGSGRRRQSVRRLQISKMHTDLVHPLPSRRG